VVQHLNSLGILVQFAMGVSISAQRSRPRKDVAPSRQI